MTAPLLTWRVRVDPPLPGAENMAWDHTLALWCGPDRGVLRLYTWDGPTLSLGRNEPAAGVYSEAALRDRGVTVVRRPTGGRAVLHHRELTYAVCAPIRALGGARAAYAEVNRALAEGLRRLGAPVTLAGPGPAAHPDAGPCFRSPAEGEVMAAGPGGDPGKLVGSAQVRMGDTLLQHGSILLEDDQGFIPRLRVEESPGTQRPATLHQVLGRSVSLDELREAVLAGFAARMPGDWRGAEPEGSLSVHGLPASPRPDLLERYRSGEWTWRR
ncbi:MAG TPA: hypothetical protein VLA43_19270 [Longimicrobiales bacterium]|nr:hypothetical protein [Longimicrobiales bacterium]